MGVTVPRVIIAGLSGDSGKTIVSLSLLVALRDRLMTSVFKKGPDYIDAAWLGFAAGRVCRNLDTFMVPEATVLGSFIRHALESDLAVIEGNRGLFDGKDVEGTHSTAGLARLLQAPVVLVINATKITRTVAALVRGCQVFDPDVHIAGVILNRSAGTRHARVMREAIEHYCGIPVVGILPKLDNKSGLVPGRHLGLVPPAEFEHAEAMTDRLAGIARDYLDIDAIVNLAGTAGPLSRLMLTPPTQQEKSAVTIGYFADSVFTFYYPENLEALENHGANLMPVSSLDDTELPEVDGLYIGGGFPETHADRLAANTVLMKAVKERSKVGMPIYAECGGLIYLARSLKWKDSVHPMAGVFDIDLELQEKPVGHGYVEAEVDRDNPFFAKGTVLRGHEFHYSGPIDSSDLTGCMRLSRGVGTGNRRDGLVANRTLGAYVHLHADGAPGWAAGMVHNARTYRRERKAGTSNKTANELPEENKRPGDPGPVSSSTAGVMRT